MRKIMDDTFTEFDAEMNMVDRQLRNIETRIEQIIETGEWHRFEQEFNTFEGEYNEMRPFMDDTKKAHYTQKYYQFDRLLRTYKTGKR
jgi:hypothetical protein